jgi:hypothetical protein
MRSDQTIFRRWLCEHGPLEPSLPLPSTGSDESEAARIGRIDRSSFEIGLWLDATLCVCHLRLVNGYVPRIAIDDDSRSS